MSSSNYYFTFGLRYREENHPVMRRVNPDGYVVVVAKSEDEARETMRNNFGIHWAFCYPEEYWGDGSAYPLGEVYRFREEGEVIPVTVWLKALEDALDRRVQRLREALNGN